MCNVLLVTCSADATTDSLLRAAGDAISVIGQFDRYCTFRERHLYRGSIPSLGESAMAALKTNPKRRSAAQWKAAACSDLLLHEVRSADVLVIAAALDGGDFPTELSEWSEHVGRATELVADQRALTLGLPPPKIAIVFAQSSSAPDEKLDNPHALAACDELRERLTHIGVTDVAIFEPDADGYPLRQAPLMLLVSRSALLH